MFTGVGISQVLRAEAKMQFSGQLLEKMVAGDWQGGGGNFAGSQDL